MSSIAVCLFFVSGMLFLWQMFYFAWAIKVADNKTKINMSYLPGLLSTILFIVGVFLV